jgi:hypothetical protein
MDDPKPRDLNARRANALHIDARDVAPRERGILLEKGAVRWIASIAVALIALGIAIFLYG